MSYHCVKCLFFYRIRPILIKALTWIGERVDYYNYMKYDFGEDWDK